MARGCIDRENPDLSAGVESDHRAGDVGHEHRHRAVHDVHLRRTHALVGHRQDVEATRELLEHFAGDMADGADPGMRERELAGIGLGGVGQFPERPDRRPRLHRDRRRRDREHRRQFEILDRIEARLPGDQRDQDVRAVAAEQQRVPSGAPRAASLRPMMPPPPPRLSMTMVPSDALRPSAHSRAITSWTPPVRTPRLGGSVGWGNGPALRPVRSAALRHRKRESGDQAEMSVHRRSPDQQTGDSADMAFGPQGVASGRRGACRSVRGGGL